MQISKNILLQSKSGRQFLADVFWSGNRSPQAAIILSHGYNGFKDWGPFNLIAEAFANAGFVFVKFNFSHNGTTPDQPEDFVDLEAFGNNNFSIEMDDLGVVIDRLLDQESPMVPDLPKIQQVSLLGHSRGGGITLLKAREDVRIASAAVWGSVSEFGKFWRNNEMQELREKGVIYKKNGRTGQLMPIKLETYLNYEANLDRLYIPDAVKNLQQPLLIVHGTADASVPVSSAEDIQKWKPDAQLFLVQDGDHNFGGKHPWLQPEMPVQLQEVVNRTIDFFRSTNLTR